ncbi:Maf family nucleotide pyrophosphatase [Orrella sp. JC864]|uniref:Maf family nucleotide pyrophosphatase n=1 Tax=Orrella sp. JC864 TaxID=3120298 RepID=UPI0012BCA18B
MSLDNPPRGGAGPADRPLLILASTSRYRREMLERLRLPFVAEPPQVDETPLPGEPPGELALRLARAKAQAVAGRHPGAVVIGSDQVAAVDGAPVGKPGGHAQAQAQLRRLSGRTVRFHSALAVTDGQRWLARDVVTECRFRTLDEAAIQAYLLAERPYDTAGSAKAESLGIALMQSMHSDDPTAIIGLPLIALTAMLAEFGLDPLRHLPAQHAQATP